MVALDTIELRALLPVAVASTLSREVASELYLEISLMTDAERAVFVAMAAVKEVTELRAAEYTEAREGSAERREEADWRRAERSCG